MLLTCSSSRGPRQGKWGPLGTSVSSEIRNRWWTRRTGYDLLVGESLVVRDVCRHVRFDEEREQVASLEVLLLDRASALLPHDFGLLLLQQLHTNPLHRCARLFDSLHAAIKLDPHEHRSRDARNKWGDGYLRPDEVQESNS